MKSVAQRYEEYRLRDINPNTKVINFFQKNDKTYCECLCLSGKQHPNWITTWNALKVGQGCKECGRISIGIKNSTPKGNSIKETRPDLIKYLKNESDAVLYTYGSTKQIQLKCPDCGHDGFSKSVNNLSRYPFSCPVCSDGISIPEKFMIFLLKNISIHFETQKSFKWSQKKRYDFYIPSLNMIIETHGLQHYESNKIKHTRKLNEEQQNDALKERLAKENGIKHYIVVDCRYSELEWLKENHIKELATHFSLLKVDWLKIWEQCQNSLKAKVWEAWNNREEHQTVKNISDYFGINRAIITLYLHQGNKIGKCVYNAKEESVKSGKRCAKIVIQYTMDGKFIREWESASEAERKLNLPKSTISNCCLNKSKQSGGFKWKYKEILSNLNNEV